MDEEEKSIIIEQEPLKERNAIRYTVSANVWYDKWETEYLVQEDPIGDPDHFLIYKSEMDEEERITSPIDIGHSREEASQKAYMHALNDAKSRINYIKTEKGLEVSLVDETVMGKITKPLRNA